MWLHSSRVSFLLMLLALASIAGELRTSQIQLLVGAKLQGALFSRYGFSFRPSGRHGQETAASVKVHSFLGTSFYKASTTGNMVVTSGFDAKNAFGTEIGYRAKCYFQPGVATGKVEISQRLK